MGVMDDKNYSSSEDYIIIIISSEQKVVYKDQSRKQSREHFKMGTKLDLIRNAPRWISGGFFLPLGSPGNIE